MPSTKLPKYHAGPLDRAAGEVVELVFGYGLHRAESERRLHMLEAIVDAHCLMLCGTGKLDSLVYWLMALDVEFDVLEPPVLMERLQQACERVRRSLERGGG